VFVVDVLEVLAQLVDLADERHVLLHDFVVFEVHAFAVGLHLVFESIHTLLQEFALVALLLLVGLEDAADVLLVDLGVVQVDDLPLQEFLVELDADEARFLGDVDVAALLDLDLGFVEAVDEALFEVAHLRYLFAELVLL